MLNAARFARLPLRQRKFARTKLGLLAAATAAMRGRPLDDVPVKALCDGVGISEASFFNYFPRKADLLVYYVQLWSIEMAWYGRQFAEARGGLAAIEEIFAMTARRVAENPAPMGEIIAGQARMAESPAFAEISLAERFLAFPDLDGVDDLEGMGLDALLPPLLDRAVRAGELPRGIDRSAAFLGLVGHFLGLPVALRRSPAALEQAYAAQLQILWAGLHASPRARP